MTKIEKGKQQLFDLQCSLPVASQQRWQLYWLISEQSADSSVWMMQCQVGQSPVYIVDGKLGKGGFGQVYVGKRSPPTSSKDGPNANLVRFICFLAPCQSLSVSMIQNDAGKEDIKRMGVYLKCC